MRQYFSKDLPVDYLDLPSKNPDLYPYPSYPYPLPLQVCKPLHITTKDNQVGSGNGVPGQEDDESGGTEKLAWVLTSVWKLG